MLIVISWLTETVRGNRARNRHDGHSVPEQADKIKHAAALLDGSMSVADNAARHKQSLSNLSKDMNSSLSAIQTIGRGKKSIGAMNWFAWLSCFGFGFYFYFYFSRSRGVGSSLA